MKDEKMNVVSIFFELCKGLIYTAFCVFLALLFMAILILGSFGLYEVTMG